MLKTGWQKLWYGRTIRTQLLVVIGVINLCALAIAGVVTIYNARHATKVEVSASMELAKQFVEATIRSVEPDGRYGLLSRKVTQLSEQLQLAQLRHVRIYMANAAGGLTPMAATGTVRSGPLEQVGESAPPAWFAALVTPEIETSALNVIQPDPTSGHLMVTERPEQAGKVWTLGTVVIQGAPEDEIAEVWEDVSSLFLLWLLLDAAMLMVLYLLLGRVLDPLAAIARGMSQLEDGQYATRLPRPRLVELGALADRFNFLAEALGRARAENARLYEQLITVQEDERREVASELHDEASPCLFGITANAFSIDQLAGKRNDRRTSEIKGHVSEILKITEHLKAMNRVLLKKLRPIALGKIPIADALTDLTNELAQRFPDVEIDHAIHVEASSYGEKVDLALYRCVQEGVTNAIRHGRAELVQVHLRENAAAVSRDGTPLPATVQLTISDDGRGISADTQVGFGMTVMRERIHALGGNCVIQTAPSQGATLKVIVPREASEKLAQHNNQTEIEMHQ
ncbi:Sensor histidine kinase LiaS [Methyloligella halotolerans]|uniref:Oxygen sensor histidine kinase NreB n=1 Tax=Methyloligella halotolerans TaxID=1177755 RepID=A0A1E2RWZ8_9HYPH|nr:Sensor histidine kinase LiaS [Methyloligella halotolerans]